MEAAKNIRDAVAQVSLLREQRLANSALNCAVLHVKKLQSRRFSGNYADLLKDARYRAAASFFLTELYSDRDFSDRDAQFSRIAGAIQRVFPQQVVTTAAALAELHALTEALDHAMGSAWLETGNDKTDAARYIQAWRIVGRRPDRDRQLLVVMDIGRKLVHLVRTPGLRLLLKMMRAPATAAGLSSLQTFIEDGFDTFSQLARPARQATEFLETIEGREAHLISLLFDGDQALCEGIFLHLLGEA